MILVVSFFNNLFVLYFRSSVIKSLKAKVSSVNCEEVIKKRLVMLVEKAWSNV